MRPGRARRMRPWLLPAIFLAAVAGVLAGRALSPPPQTSETALHRLLHDDMRLDRPQKAALAALEARFAERRQRIEATMRADNRRLAAAIAIEQDAGPRVMQAVDRSHAAMGRLQKETLAHVFAMRRLLRADQVTQFDRAVARALTEDAR